MVEGIEKRRIAKETQDGITNGIRKRTDEIQKANPRLTRDQAFNRAASEYRRQSAYKLQQPGARSGPWTWRRAAPLTLSSSSGYPLAVLPLHKFRFAFALSFSHECDSAMPSCRADGAGCCCGIRRYSVCSWCAVKD